MNSVTNTIIILNYCDAGRTGDLAKSIEPYTCIDKIILVDNASPDGSFQYLQNLSKDSDKIDAIKTPENRGYATGNHYGILYALKKYNPDYLMIANPDVSFSEETARAMLSAIDISRHSSRYNTMNVDSMSGSEHSAIHESGPSANNASPEKIAVVAPLVRKGRNVWRLPGFVGLLESLFLFWFNIDKALIRRSILRDRRELVPAGVIEGSFFVISTAAYREIGGFDRNTFLYGEEIILAKRLKDKGYTEAVLRDHFYDHLHSASIKKKYHSSKAKAFIHIENSFEYYARRYLKASHSQLILFKLCCRLALLERQIFDGIHHVVP